MSTDAPAHAALASPTLVGWMARSPLASFARAFVATMLTLALADLTSAASVGFANWRSWLVAALAASAPILIRWINPQDTAYGSGHEAARPAGRTGG